VSAESVDVHQTRLMRSNVGVGHALLGAAWLAFAPMIARADEPRCAAIHGGSDELAQHAPIDRLLWIQRRLDVDAKKARIWTWTFVGIYTGLIVGNGTHLILDHRTYNNTADNSVAVGGSVFGLLVLTIMPPAVLRDQHKLARVVTSWRDDHACATLAEAEKILVRDAKGEAFGKGPLAQMGNLGFNFALGIFVGLALHRWPTGFIVGPVAAAAGEVQLLSLPTHINDTLAQYRLGDLRERPTDARLIWSVSPLIGSNQVGVGGGFAF
jgi:hypothetical protein